MHDKNLALIPWTAKEAGLDQTSGDFQIRLFSERREAALAEIRMMPGILAVARNLAPGELYRLILPDAQILQKTKDGLYSGVFYGPDGKISNHAKFETVSPSLSRIAATIGSQVLLVSIAMQLNRLEKAIEAISNELHYDRIAEIVAGVQQYEMASQMTDPTKRDRCIQHAIQSLTEGLVKVRFEMRGRIHNMPSSANGYWDNWGGSKTSRATKELALAQESFHAALVATSTLSECYAALNEPKAGIASMTRCLEDIQDSGIQSAAEKARVAKVVDKNCLPEAPWLGFDTARRSFLEAASRTQLEEAKIASGQLAIDFKPGDLLEDS